MGENEDLKTFLRKKLDSGISAEELRQGMVEAGIPVVPLDEILGERTQIAAAVPMQSVAAAPANQTSVGTPAKEMVGTVPANEAGFWQILKGDKGLFFWPILIESLFFIFLLFLNSIPVLGLLSIPLALLGVILISFNTYNICRKCVQAHGFSFLHSVVLSFTQALIVATIFLFSAVGIFFLFFNSIYPAFFPSQIESLMQDPAYANMQFAQVVWIALLGTVFIFVIVLVLAVIYRIVLSLFFAGIFLRRNPEPAKGLVLKKDDNGAFVLAGLTVLIVIIADAILVFSVFYGAAASGAFEAIGKSVDEGKTQGQLSGYGFKQLELKGGQVWGYKFDQSHADFSLVFQYDKSKPRVLDLNSVRFSKPGKDCTAFASQRISGAMNQGPYISSSLATGGRIELSRGQTFTINGIVHDIGCGMASEDFNYTVSFDLVEEDTGLKTTENGKVSGTYIAATQPTSGYYGNVAYYHLMTANFPEAEKNYLLALKSDPDNLLLIKSLALVYIFDEQYRKSADLVDSVIESNARDAELQFLGGTSNLRIKNFEKAELYFKNALELDPDDSMSRYFLMDTYFENGAFEKGLQTAEEMTLMQPNDPIAYYYVGLFSMQLQEYQKAETALLKAIEISPEYAQALSLLAQCYEETGQTAKRDELLNRIPE